MLTGSFCQKSPHLPLIKPGVQVHRSTIGNIRHTDAIGGCLSAISLGHIYGPVFLWIVPYLGFYKFDKYPLRLYLFFQSLPNFSSFLLNIKWRALAWSAQTAKPKILRHGNFVENVDKLLLIR
jgi:hypothetical protein